MTASVPPDETPRVFTREEIRDKLHKHVWSLVNYWEKVDNPGRNGTTRDRLYGEFRWKDSYFQIVDTGGLLPGRPAPGYG